MKTQLFVKGFLATAFCFFFAAAQAQSNWGIKAAATTSDFRNKSFKELFSTVPDIGAMVGVFGELELTKLIRLRAELNGAWRGTSKHFWMGNDVDLYSANLPVFVEVVPIKNLIVGAGAEASYLLGVSGASYKDYKKLDAGLALHVEYRLMQRFGISLRYVHGLLKTNPVQTTDSQGNTNTTLMANRSLQLGISYSFGKFAKAKK